MAARTHACAEPTAPSESVVGILGSLNPDRQHRSHPIRSSGEARFAIVISAVTVGVVVVTQVIFAVTWLVAGQDAVSDMPVGMLAGAALLGGLVILLVCFVLAVVAVARHGRTPLLWIPLTALPLLVALVVLAEVFVLE